MSSTLKKVGATSDDTTKEVRELKNEVEGLNNVRLGGFLSTIGKIASVIGIGTIVSRSIQEGMERGMKNISFEVLFGSVESAKQMIDEIDKYAAKAYGTSALTNAVQMMAGFDIAKDEIIPNLKAIGDIAMGDVQRFNSLTLAFSQMSSTGKLMGQDLLQMINAEFNPLVQMSKTTGKSVAQLKDEMSKGLITSQMVKQAFYDAAGAGGQFHGMIDRISDSAGGLWQKVLSNVSLRLLDLYKIIEPILIPALKGLNLLLTDTIGFFAKLADRITNLHPVVLGIGGAILTVATAIGIVKAASVAYLTVTKLITFFKGIETAAWWANNAAMLANPVTWIVAGVIALIAVIAYLIIKIDGWGKMWEHTVNGAKLLFNAFTESVKFYFNTMINGLMIGLNKIKQGWYEFKEAVGIGDSTQNQQMLAQINADTEARKKAILDGANNVANLSIQAAEEFKKAAGSLSWNDKSFSDIANDIKNKLGISTPGLPGTDMATGFNGTGTTGGNFGGSAGKSTANSIATGGQKTTNITINLGELVGSMVINASGIREGAGQVRDIVLDEMTRVLAMAQGQT